MSNNYQIDLLGLKCPLPVLRANKKFKEFSNKTVIDILVDDPAAPEDFKIFCKTKKYTLISVKKNLKYTIITIKI